MATIMTTHIPMNDVPAASQLCPGILIHIMESDQLPGMRMPSDMDRHQ